MSSLTFDGFLFYVFWGSSALIVLGVVGIVTERRRKRPCGRCRAAKLEEDWFWETTELEEES